MLEQRLGSALKAKAQLRRRRSPAKTTRLSKVLFDIARAW
jgi:hypothetical protein